MRGAQPDAECPRCHHAQPPTGALAHCAKCGLTYPPKELVRPSRPKPGTALVAAMPRELRIEQTPVDLAYRWSERPYVIVAQTLATIGVVSVVFLLNLGFAMRVGVLMTMGALLAYAWHDARRITRIAIDRTQVIGLDGRLLLADVERFEHTNGRIVASTKQGTVFELARTRHVEIADYVSGELAQRLSSGFESPPRDASDRPDR